MELSKLQLVNTFLIVIITIISLFQLFTINKIEDQIERLRKIDLPLFETEIKNYKKKIMSKPNSSKKNNTSKPKSSKTNTARSS